TFPFSPLPPPSPPSPLFPYTTLFRSPLRGPVQQGHERGELQEPRAAPVCGPRAAGRPRLLRGQGELRRGAAGVDHRSGRRATVRSEEHTSELQSRFDLVCRLLLEKKN